MAITITDIFVQQYTANIFHLAQQKGSRLRGAVIPKTQVGKTAFYDRIGKVSAALRTGRHANTPLVDTPFSRRMVTMADYEWADLVDQQDKLRMLIDPTSEMARAAGFGFGRSIDEVIIAAMRGNAATGETGSVNVALPDTQKLVPTDGTTVSAFDMAALMAIKKKFDDADVDESIQRYIALSSQQLQDLLNQTKVTSSDYNSVKALVKGELDSFMGFRFIRTQLLPKGAAPAFTKATGIVEAGGLSTMTNARSVLAWAGDGVLMAVGQEPIGKISERADKSYATQAYMSMSIGAVRLEEEKVVECICKESDSVIA